MKKIPIVYIEDIEYTFQDGLIHWICPRCHRKRETKVSNKFVPGKSLAVICTKCHKTSVARKWVG